LTTGIGSCIVDLQAFDRNIKMYFIDHYETAKKRMKDLFDHSVPIIVIFVVVPIAKENSAG
jgi:hypothetical protein